MNEVGFFIGAFLAKLLDPGALVLCLIIVVLSRSKLIIPIAALTAWVIVELIITKNSYTGRQFGTGPFSGIGLLTCFLTSTVFFLLRKKFFPETKK